MQQVTNNINNSVTNNVVTNNNIASPSRTPGTTREPLLLLSLYRANECIHF